jgi:hypothetical protein
MEVSEEGVEVKYLRQRGGTWIFPAVDDVSLEDRNVCTKVDVTKDRRNRHFVL